jgi:hypothetical protein
MRAPLPIVALLACGMGLACAASERPVEVLAPYQEPPAPAAPAPPPVQLTWVEETAGQCSWMLGTFPGREPRALASLGADCPEQWSVIASGSRSALFGPGWGYLLLPGQEALELPESVPFERLTFDETSLLACGQLEGSPRIWRWAEPGWEPLAQGRAALCPAPGAARTDGSGVPSSGWKPAEPADQASLAALAQGAWLVSEDGQFAARGEPVEPLAVHPPLAWRLEDGWQLVYGFEIFKSHNSFAFQDGWLLLRMFDKTTLQRAGSAPVLALPSARGAAFWPADQPAPP